VTSFLRFAGILNAAVWCGASIFLFIGLPAVFSDDLKRELGQIGVAPGAQAMGVGFAAQAVLARYFILQYCCAAIALAHLALEWLYAGKPLLQRNLAILAALAGLALAGGLWMQPKLKDLHHTMYLAPTQPAREEAARAFRAWHGVSECGNLLVVGGLLVYLWRASRPGDQARFGNLNWGKIRG
jgi:hypothetical protein